MQRREVFTRGLAGVALIGAVGMTEIGCSTGMVSNFAVLLSALTAVVDIGLPILATFMPGIAPFVPAIEAVLSATQTFVQQAAAILASNVLTPLQKASQILALGNPILEQLHIPGIPPQAAALLLGIAAALQAILAAVTAASGAAPILARTLGTNAIDRLAQPSAAELRHLHAVAHAANAESLKIAVALKLA